MYNIPVKKSKYNIYIICVLIILLDTSWWFIFCLTAASYNRNATTETNDRKTCLFGLCDDFNESKINVTNSLDRIKSILQAAESFTASSTSTNNIMMQQQQVNGTNQNDWVCLRYAEDAARRPEVIHNVFSYAESSGLVTLVTHVTMERIESFFTILNTWKGPVSASLHASPEGFATFVKLYRSRLSIEERENIYIHLVKQEGFHYPVNYMRNVALNYTTTKFVFLIDVDFIPATNLETAIAQHIETLDLHKNKMKALVVPAFQLNDVPSGKLPLTKTSLLRGWLNSNSIEPFYIRASARCHGPTDYTRWKTSRPTETYEVTYTEYYEPYIVIDRQSVPPFDQRFVGRFYNKQAHLLLLNHLGFSFTVVPDSFILHLPHRIIAESQKYYRRCALSAYTDMKEGFANIPPLY